MFDFISDRPVLDFIPTLAARGTRDEELLRTSQDLADWITQSGIVENRVALDEHDLDRSRKTREALFRLVAALIGGRRADALDSSLVEALAAAPLPMLRLDGDTLHRSGDLDAVLAVLSRDCLDLLAGPDRTALRFCADETCLRPFVDRSHGHRRRWCGMKGCGDRAKAAAYRDRQRAARAG